MAGGVGRIYGRQLALETDVGDAPVCIIAPGLLATWPLETGPFAAGGRGFGQSGEGRGVCQRGRADAGPWPGGVGSCRLADSRAATAPAASGAREDPLFRRDGSVLRRGPVG